MPLLSYNCGSTTLSEEHDKTLEFALLQNGRDCKVVGRYSGLYGKGEVEHIGALPIFPTHSYFLIGVKPPIVEKVCLFVYIIFVMRNRDEYGRK